MITIRRLSTFAGFVSLGSAQRFTIGGTDSAELMRVNNGAVLHHSLAASLGVAPGMVRLVKIEDFADTSEFRINAPQEAMVTVAIVQELDAHSKVTLFRHSFSERLLLRHKNMPFLITR